MSKNKSESWWIIYRFCRLDKKLKKTTINPTNDNEKCFKYAATVTLNLEEIEKKNRKEHQKLSLS